MEPALHRPQLTEAGSGNELKNQNREKEFLRFAPVCFSFPEPDSEKKQKTNLFSLLGQAPRRGRIKPNLPLVRGRAAEGGRGSLTHHLQSELGRLILANRDFPQRRMQDDLVATAVQQ